MQTYNKPLGVWHGATFIYLKPTSINSIIINPFVNLLFFFTFSDLYLHFASFVCLLLIIIIFLNYYIIVIFS